MKTIIAPCIGGPLHGKLKRTDWVLERLLVPGFGTFGPVYHLYKLERTPEGNSWVHAGEGASPTDAANVRR